MTILRAAEPADVPAIQEVVREAYSRYVPRIGKPPAPMLDDYARLVRDGRVTVAERSGKVVGVLVLVPRPDHLLLDNVAVHPHAQGQRIGRLLLNEAERVARQHGYATIRLYTNEAMTENIGLYRHIGYVETHRVEEGGYRRVFMARTLA